MQKQAPGLRQILTMSAFAFSCFLILLLLWLSFGGPVPLKAEGYRVKVAFDEAVQLGQDADVRTSGITIGTVRKSELEESTGRTLATLVIDSDFAPVASDARAILRTKTLLGETYVELAPGSRGARKVADGGRLDDSRVAPTVELDEVLASFDPVTRTAFRAWQQELGVATRARGEPLNDALGQLPEFTTNASNLLEVLDRHERAVKGLVRDSGAVYGALTRDEGRLRDLVQNSHGVFRQTADQRESLAEAFQIFPTFLSESKLTLDRLERFSRNTRPLIEDLRPVARDLRPTIRSVRAFAPDLKRFFLRFDQQIRASKRGLPALREILDETRPAIGALGPFFHQLNPILEWIEVNQHLVSDFLSNGPSALADRTPSANPGEVGHYLRQLTLQGTESLGIHPRRLSTNRGNSYLPPVFTGKKTASFRIFPNFDCKPSGGERRGEVGPRGAGGSTPACFVADKMLLKGKRQGQFPHVEAENYKKGR